MTLSTKVPVAVVIVAIALTAVTYVGRDVPSSPERPSPSTAVGVLPAAGGTGAVTQAPGQPELAELERLIRAFGEQTTETPNAAGFTFLGQLEAERARLTGDVASYARAEDALTRALELAPTDGDAQTLLAGVRFTTHDFTGALSLASEVYERDGDPAALAIRGDAALELGRYDAARADYRELERIAPTAAGTFVRRARLAYLTGDAEAARRLAAAAERAAVSEGAYGATRAWYAAFRGDLALDEGAIDDAVAHYGRAVRAAPDYHVAIAGMAAARAAQGRVDDAIRLYERAADDVPEPGTLAALGDLYASTGDDRAAADRYATVEAIATLAGADRLYDRQLALFRADHGGDLEEALAIARESLEARRDVYGYDALAWVLHALGRDDEAREASDAALALATPDPILWYHAGMISAALGDAERARVELGRALELNARFDPLLAPVAKRTLERLGGATP